jgi:8-hydroxy-5-deazaflavin:NADPH oxidoreductase
MKVGVLGTGDVGRALGRGFVTLGHEVKMGSRSDGNEKAVAWAKEMGPKASVGSFAEAAAFGEIVVLAVFGTAVESALREAGPASLRGKVVIDATNPLDFTGGFPPKLVAGADGSGGQTAQRVAPEAHVVKAFNTVGNAHMFRPDFPGGPPDMFICGNDAEAKKKVGALLQDFGWSVVDVGGIDASHGLEAMCLVWVLYGARTDTWSHAFKLLRK